MPLFFVIEPTLFLRRTFAKCQAHETSKTAFFGGRIFLFCRLSFRGSCWLAHRGLQAAPLFWDTLATCSGLAGHLSQVALKKAGGVVSRRFKPNKYVRPSFIAQIGRIPPKSGGLL